MLGRHRRLGEKLNAGQNDLAFAIGKTNLYLRMNKKFNMKLLYYFYLIASVFVLAIVYGTEFAQTEYTCDEHGHLLYGRLPFKAVFTYQGKEYEGAREDDRITWNGGDVQNNIRLPTQITKQLFIPQITLQGGFANDVTCSKEPQS